MQLFVGRAARTDACEDEVQGLHGIDKGPDRAYALLQPLNGPHIFPNPLSQFFL